jgi:hypothetical protein
MILKLEDSTAECDGHLDIVEGFSNRARGACGSACGAAPAYCRVDPRGHVQYTTLSPVTGHRSPVTSAWLRGNATAHTANARAPKLRRSYPLTQLIPRPVLLCASRKRNDCATSRRDLRPHIRAAGYRGTGQVCPHQLMLLSPAPARSLPYRPPALFQFAISGTAHAVAAI